MKITLAVEYGKHKPDATIDLGDAEAKQLISQGRARLADSAKSDKPDKVAEAVLAKAEESKATATVTTVAAE